MPSGLFLSGFLLLSTCSCCFSLEGAGVCRDGVCCDGGFCCWVVGGFEPLCAASPACWALAGGTIIPINNTAEIKKEKGDGGFTIWLSPRFGPVPPYRWAESATGYLDFPVILPNPFECDLDVPIAREARKLLSPLYQENAVLGDQVIQPQRLQLPRRVNPIQINVIEVYDGSMIFVHQREGGAGHVFFRRRLE